MLILKRLFLIISVFFFSYGLNALDIKDIYWSDVYDCDQDGYKSFGVLHYTIIDIPDIVYQPTVTVQYKIKGNDDWENLSFGLKGEGVHNLDVLSPIYPLLYGEVEFRIVLKNTLGIPIFIAAKGGNDALDYQKFEITKYDNCVDLSISNVTVVYETDSVNLDFKVHQKGMRDSIKTIVNISLKSKNTLDIVAGSLFNPHTILLMAGDSATYSLKVPICPEFGVSHLDTFPYHLTLQVDEYYNLVTKGRKFDVNDSNNSWIDSLIEIKHCNFSSVKKLDDFDIKVYPNPSLGGFKINFLESKKEFKRYSIYDSFGRELEKETLFNVENLEVGKDLPAGIYLLLIESVDEHFSVKLEKL